MKKLARDFKDEIDNLVAGNISEITVEQDEFLAFREAWLKHPEKSSIMGEAGLNGRIIYRFQKEVKN